MIPVEKQARKLDISREESMMILKKIIIIEKKCGELVR